MIAADFILSKLPPYNATSAIISTNQSVNDIKKAILKSFETDKQQYATIAPYFVGKTVLETCKNVFDFLRANVINITESVETQSVKSPAAIIATGKTIGSDCKNYSLFSAGILDAINRSGLQKIPIAFRFCRYKQFDGSYMEHVFVVVNPNKKNEIWVDCIKDVPYFNSKRYPDFYTDKKINSMALVRMSGTPKLQKNTIINGLLSERAKRLANGQIVAGSFQDKRYINALGAMGVQVAPPNTSFTQTLINQQVPPTGNFLNNFMHGGSGAVSSLVTGLTGGGGIDVKTILTTGANFVPVVGPILSSVIGPLLTMFPGKGGLYNDWSKDADGGLAEIVRWIRNDGDNPKQEALDALRLMNERGFENYIGKPTRYNDYPLTVDDVINKLQRVGLTREADQLKQGIQKATTNTNNGGLPPSNGTAEDVKSSSSSIPLLLTAAAAALLILKK